MKIKEIKLYDCIFDSELKSAKDNKFNTVAKVKIGEFENIILFEFTHKQANYIKSNDENTLFNVVGSFQVRKNKKDIGFLFLKVDSIISILDLEEEKKVSIEKNRKKREKERKIKAQKEIQLKWTDKINEICGDSTKVDYRKIDIIDREHLRNTNIDFSARYIECKELKCVVKAVEGTDRYRLVFGWKQLITAKLFDREIEAYIFDGSKDELIEKIMSIEKDV